MSEAKGEQHPLREDARDREPGGPRPRPREQEGRAEEQRRMKQQKEPEARLPAKSGKKVLSKAAPYLPERAVHSHGDDLSAVEAEAALSARAPEVREHLIFEKLIPHGRVPAHLEIARALGQYARAVGEGERSVPSRER